MNTIFDIAYWFLQKEEMTHKKLQKLCYYAQAWSLALCENKIMEDAKFEAWVHGPVNCELWSVFRDKAWTKINATELEEKAKPIEGTEYIELLESVWETYGELYGSQLEALTHKETPWIIARKGLYEFAICHEIISETDMKNYYKSIYAGNQGD